MNKKRLNVKDIWNFKLINQKWENDIPKYNSKNSIPEEVITYSEALKIYKYHMKLNDKNYKCNKYVYFTLEDINMNKAYDVWYNYKFIAKVTSHFEGIIAPYYACEYTKREIHHKYNIYKMQTIGSYFASIGQKVIYNFVPLYLSINNICMSGIKVNSIIYIDIHNYTKIIPDNNEFEKCLYDFIKIKKPKHFVLIGDDNNQRLDIIKNTNIPFTLFTDKNIYNFFENAWSIIESNDEYFNDLGFPICIPLKQSVPNRIISWSNAKELYKKISCTNSDFKIDAYVHFYMDDQNFDGRYKGVWNNPIESFEILSHFRGIITIDYSTYIDFPEPIKQFAVYRMILSGIMANNYGIEVIHNLRLDFFGAYPNDYIPKNNIICIGTVASSLKKNIYKDIFNKIYNNYFLHNNPKYILTFGSSKYDVFKTIELRGVQIKSYSSHKNIIFKGGEKNV